MDRNAMQSQADRAATARDAEQILLDERIDDIVAMHDGDWRAALATLLIVADARARTISHGYVRGRPPFGDEIAERA